MSALYLTATAKNAKSRLMFCRNVLPLRPEPLRAFSPLREPNSTVMAPQGQEKKALAACGSDGLALSRPSPYLCHPEGPGGWDYKRIMAITGHATFAVFQRYNNPSEEDSKAVGLADPPRKVVG